MAVPVDPSRLPSWSSPTPSFRMPEIKLPPIPPSPLVTNVEENYASEFCRRLSKWINEFDASLDDQHEVGVRLVSFGQTVIFHLHGIGYYNPSLISFTGTTDEGQPVTLIQHVSQISILLMKLSRLDPTKPKHRIGFRQSQDDVDDNAESEDLPTRHE